MELSKKTTILLSEELHGQLTTLAKTEGKSLGQLVRDACVQQYGITSREEKREAVRRLASLNAPVDTVEVMKSNKKPLAISTEPNTA